MLFADVKGSMDLAEQLDPEEWHKILDRFFEILTDGVHRFEGTVNQYTGDGIMALFGAPIAHEDHAQRACYAALHLQRAAPALRGRDASRERGLNFSVRMGLNSGEVVVGKIGDDLRMDYTAQGHTVGLAARMEQIADPGKALLTGRTAKLVSGYVQLRDLGETRIKGLSDPLRVFELEGVARVRTRLDVSRARGFTKLVGRQDEMAALEAALARATGGSAHVVGVVASRAWARAASVTSSPSAAARRGSPSTKLMPWPTEKPFLSSRSSSTCADISGLTNRIPRSPRAKRSPVRCCCSMGSWPKHCRYCSTSTASRTPKGRLPKWTPKLVSDRSSPPLRGLMHAQSRREPTVSLIEDLHWIDRGSETFLENLVEALPGTRILLVVNFRPEYHAAWMQRSYYQQLPLAPLSAEAIDALLRDLLGADASVKALPELIRERTGGNPFFIEEVVQALVEDGSLVGVRGDYRLVRPIEKVAVPATVQAVLAARIDRLESREKHLLQTAAVIGKEFAEPVLKRVAELSEAELPESLGKLAAAEFIYEEALYPQAEYAFKHPLTQEVAYRSQLAERRSRTHAAVARAIAELYPEQLDERAALLAHHWEQAGETARAAEWHRRAALWAGGRTSRRRHATGRRCGRSQRNCPSRPRPFRLCCRRVESSSTSPGARVCRTPRPTRCSPRLGR